MDYFSPTIYLTDILIVTILTTSIVRKLSEKNFNTSFKRDQALIMFGLLFLVIVNIYYSTVPVLSTVKWISIFEMVLLMIYVKQRKTFNVRNLLIIPLIYSSILFGVIGIIQFYLQRSIGGPFYFLGERSFNANTVGIAVVSLLNIDRLRAYSTFPHPNALAGYAAVVLMLLLNSYKSIKDTKNYIPMVLSLGILSVVLILTFSKAAYVSIVLIALLYMVNKAQDKYKHRLVKMSFLLIVSVSFLLAIITPTKTNYMVGRSVLERVKLANVAGQEFSENVFTGVGENNFIIKLSKRELPTQIKWLLQPVHNIYLLVLSEAGIFIFIIFVYFLYKILTIALKTKSNLLYIYLFILLTGVFDHYWLTIKQNQIIASLIIAVIIREYYAGVKRKRKTHQNIL